MQMTYCLLTIAMACCLSSPGVTLSVSCNHKDAIYAVGEEAVLSIAATDDYGMPARSGIFCAGVDNFGPEEIVPRQTYDLAVSNPVEIKAKMSKPGLSL